MRVESLDIHGVGGIKELSLKFNEGLNIICGTNGIGKTTVLNVIADFFAYGNRNIRRNANVDEGFYELKCNDNQLSKKNNVKQFKPLDSENVGCTDEIAKFLLNFGANRDMSYVAMKGIPSDVSRSDYQLGLITTNGVAADEIKGWFVSRQLYSGQKKGFTDIMRKNYELAVRVFGLLDDTIKFDYIDLHKHDIMLQTTGGSIFFEYLSSGYKTCIYIILGILKEIEYRFVDPEVAFDEFKGIILIDEIDLHLHPTWQTQLVKALKEIFSKAQIIATTHSPSILQSLNKDEIIALEKDDEGNTFVKKLDLGEYGLQGWTLEEILQDVMGMPSTTSELYESTINEFDKAMDEEDGKKIMEQYEILKKMLHPKNPLQKLLKLQIAEWEE
jgi:predicted ATP-binding protein involved in virulence